MLKALAVALTLSLKFMTTVELTGTLVAPFAGVVVVTVGAASAALAVPFALKLSILPVPPVPTVVPLIAVVDVSTTRM